MLRGPTRYGELKRAIRNVSDKVLIQQLKELEADGVLRRNDYKEVPPRVDYTLTELGQSLARALEPLCQWGTDNMVVMQKLFAARDGWGRERIERQAIGPDSTSIAPIASGSAWPEVGRSRPSFRFQELANRSSLCTERSGISQLDRSRPQCSDQRIARQGNAGVAQGRFGPDKIVCVGRHADRRCNFDKGAGRTFGPGEIAG